LKKYYLMALCFSRIRQQLAKRFPRPQLLPAVASSRPPWAARRPAEDEMTLKDEGVVNGGMNGKEALGPIPAT
jgi:hypothetical protein